MSSNVNADTGVDYAALVDSSSFADVFASAAMTTTVAALPRRVVAAIGAVGAGGGVI